MSSARFFVDAALCERAQRELAQILQLQDRKFAARFDAFEDAAFRAKFMTVARIVCVALALSGFALCALALVLDPYRAWLRAETLMMVTFVALGSFSWYALPALSERIFQRTIGFRQRIREWSHTRSRASCSKLAQKILKKAVALAPYEASYEMKGSVLGASRIKNGESVVAWQRDLAKFRSRGLAMTGGNVTVLFRRRGWIVPSACVLHVDSEWIRDTLLRFEIATDILEGQPAGD